MVGSRLPMQHDLHDTRIICPAWWEVNPHTARSPVSGAYGLQDGFQEVFIGFIDIFFILQNTS
jgi:hypothetical protein